jgi:hypothetical protein
VPVFVIHEVPAVSTKVLGVQQWRLALQPQIAAILIGAKVVKLDVYAAQHSQVTDLSSS